MSADVVGGGRRRRKMSYVIRTRKAVSKIRGENFCDDICKMKCISTVDVMSELPFV